MSLKERLLGHVELWGLALAWLMRLGLVSGAALAAALGQIALALVLAAIAAGMFLRVWRLRRRRGQRSA